VTPTGLAPQGVEVRPDTIEEINRATVLAPPWVTLLWNCDCHTFDQVAAQLVKAIGCTHDDAMAIAWCVHSEGKAVVRVGAREECERVGRVLSAIGLRVSIVVS